MALLVNGQHIETDSEGYLWHLSDWSMSVAQSVAELDNILLTTQHWQVINFLRAHYQAYEHSPSMRELVAHLRTTDHGQTINTRTLNQLFPKGPIKQGSKIAGLPKPPHCI